MSFSQEQPPENIDESLREYLTRRFIDVANALSLPSKFPPRKEPPYKPQIGDVHLFNDPTDYNYDAAITEEGFWGYISTGWILLNAAGVDLKPYCVTGAGVNLTTTEATMDLSTEQISDANYALASDQITVTLAGTYQISYGVQVLEDGTGGASRSGTTFHVEIGTTPIVQSEMSNYNRELSGPSGSSITFLVVLSASDVLQLRGFVDYTATTDVSQGVTSMSIIKLA